MADEKLITLITDSIVSGDYRQIKQIKNYQALFLNSIIEEVTGGYKRLITPLEYALNYEIENIGDFARKNHSPLKTLLKEAKLDINDLDHNGNNLLHNIVARGSLANYLALRLLIDYGAKVNYPNKLGKTAINIVADLGFPNLQIARLLILSGAKIDKKLADQAKDTLTNNQQFIEFVEFHQNDLKAVAKDVTQKMLSSLKKRKNNDDRGENFTRQLSSMLAKATYTSERDIRYHLDNNKNFQEIISEIDKENNSSGAAALFDKIWQHCKIVIGDVLAKIGLGYSYKISMLTELIEANIKLKTIKEEIEALDYLLHQTIQSKSQRLALNKLPVQSYNSKNRSSGRS